MKTAAYCILSVILMAGCTSPKVVNEIQTAQLVKSTRSWDGQPLPAYKQGTPEITILRITIPPGQALPVHTHPVINAGILLKGELTVTTETGQVKKLNPYDPLVEVVNTWHYGRNDGDEPAEIIVFYAGANGEPITIKKTENKPAHKELEAAGKPAP